MAIDLTRLPPPTIIEALDFETLQDAFLARFAAAWAAQQAIDPTLPPWNVGGLETDSVAIASEAWSYLRLLDRQRVNDAIKAVLAPLAQGNDLDTVVARIGVERLVVTPATNTAAAVMESDARLLQRYLLAFTRPAAGSADRYLYEAMTAWPALLSAKVNGRAIHGRRGDVDIVVAGPAGRNATDAELSLVRTAVVATSVKPEATSVSVLRATRVTYDIAGRIVVPTGPDAEAVRAEAAARVRRAGDARMMIGAEVPLGALIGAAYGTSVSRVDFDAPSTDLVAAPYAIPVLGAVNLAVEVAG